MKAKDIPDSNNSDGDTPEATAHATIGDFAWCWVCFYRLFAHGVGFFVVRQAPLQSRQYLRSSTIVKVSALSLDLGLISLLLPSHNCITYSPTTRKATDRHDCRVYYEQYHNKLE